MKSWKLDWWDNKGFFLLQELKERFKIRFWLCKIGIHNYCSHIGCGRNGGTGRFCNYCSKEKETNR